MASLRGALKKPNKVKPTVVVQILPNPATIPSDAPHRIRIEQIKVPNVHGSIFQFEGQASVFDPASGPCYRCLYPEPPPPGMAPSCAEAGVLGVLPGLIGCIQALETIKIILGKGDTLVGKLLCFNTLTMEITTLNLKKDPEFPFCC